MTVEENARSLVISAFQSKDRQSFDARGLALVMAGWLDIRRPTMDLTGGKFVIHCRNEADAKLVESWFGGTRVKNVVRGHIVDLTL